ncbi:hypothetical protein Ddye_018957 [Dipteronia dyeriana]|uniref:Uncharacterized protein n=1 Tax=Dipteronia dyeriana TaxID=168575 RepID=A0AAD9TX72_9ROSI|nr:hypothetical protein Ddye_018957 [Dipteronia dyeriana]
MRFHSPSKARTTRGADTELLLANANQSYEDKQKGCVSQRVNVGICEARNKQRKRVLASGAAEARARTVAYTAVMSRLDMLCRPWQRHGAHTAT